MGAFNKMQTEMSMKDLLDLHKRDIMLSLNCHGIATVKTFDSGAMTITAAMNYSKTFYQNNAQGVVVPVLRPYPLLVDCPVVILGGGGCSVTFPIAAGDECLIIFNDRDMDNWIEGATSGPVATNRLHSFSDAIALVGFFAPSSYDATRAVLGNGTTGVGVGPAKVKVFNNSTTLNTLLQQLITDLNTFATGLNAGTLAAKGTALAAALAMDATNIAGLLE